MLNEFKDDCHSVRIDSLKNSLRNFFGQPLLAIDGEYLHDPGQFGEYKNFADG